MKGARSIVSLALPMDVDAIYGFLSKKCQTGHAGSNPQMESTVETPANLGESISEPASAFPERALPAETPLEENRDQAAEL